MRKICLFLILGTLLSGCSFVVNGRNKTINLLSSTGEEATVSVTSENGVQEVSIPGTITVKRANAPITITVKETKCNKPSTTIASEKVSMWAFGNVLLWVFGLTGTTVDATTGSMWNYDDNIVVPVYKKDSCKKD